jgi:hypothetical protein
MVQIIVILKKENFIFLFIIIIYIILILHIYKNIFFFNYIKQILVSNGIEKIKVEKLV